MASTRNLLQLQHPKLQHRIGGEVAVAGVEKDVDAAMALVGVEGVVDSQARHL